MKKKVQLCCMMMTFKPWLFLVNNVAVIICFQRHFTSNVFKIVISIWSICCGFVLFVLLLLYSRRFFAIHRLHLFSFHLTSSLFVNSFNGARLLNRFWFSVVSQKYEVSVMEEYVLKGNAAILKCHIPSFVADFVYVSSWLQDGDTELLPSNNEFGTFPFDSWFLVAGILFWARSISFIPSYLYHPYCLFWVCKPIPLLRLNERVNGSRISLSKFYLWHFLY